ncbi:hypothetical protein DPMN_120533 [Dreissena polymorpha]|uniref:Uncharacterized protein n=1 Tax=Dreissena polymorpha TaxID=45954 RepID=A0A9D4GRR6_DREPO|nr:hypothetical protein DPMN_120533 [Dreissena polymorpha]
MKLVLGKKLQLQQRCTGIAFQQEELFITADTALYKYTASGKQVSKMYEDTSDKYTVHRCAVSPTGDKLYITYTTQKKLLTLARDGSALATFTDPALQLSYGVHVTPAGQVLVCGLGSCTILQVDSEDRKKLATLATKEDRVLDPNAVCYNRHTGSIIVGLYCSNSILVLKSVGCPLSCECSGWYKRFSPRRSGCKPHFQKHVQARNELINLDMHTYLLSRLSNILDIDLALDYSDVSMPWRRRYPRFDARHLNRRHNDEWCTVGECNPNVFRGRPRQIGSHSVINISAVHLNITKRFNILTTISLGGWVLTHTSTT